MGLRDQLGRSDRHCQYVDCRRPASRRELWRIDDASVVVHLCDEHAFKGPAPRMVSGERWATRARA